MGRSPGLRWWRRLILVIVAAVACAAGGSAPSPLIVFATGGDAHTGVLDIAVAEPDGTGFRNLTHNEPGGFEPTWTPDGRGLIVWTYDSFTGNESPWSISTDGHRRALIHGDGSPSPDGRYMMELASKGLVLRTASGRLVRTLPLPLGRDEFVDSYPYWSPDARFVAVVVTNDDTAAEGSWLVPVGGGAPLQLTRNGSEEFPWAFSTDAHWLLTYTDPGHAFEWSTDGKVRRIVRGGLTRAWSATWSPDSKRIAFVGQHGDIYVTNAAVSRGVRIARTSSAAKDLRSVGIEWDPSGTLVAFSERDALYVVRAAGGRAALVTTRCSFCDPRWRPNGREIAFSSGGSSFAVSVRTHVVRRITGEPVDADSPVWSPSRSRIAFTRATDKLNNPLTLSVYTMRADGTGLTRIGRGYRPQWAPDSQRVLYVDPVGSAELQDGALGAGAIMVGGLDGTSTRVATGTSPTWSPDGHTIAFVHHTFGPSEDGGYVVTGTTLSLVGADGSSERVLASSEELGGAFFDPRWSPDGTAIAVAQQHLVADENGDTSGVTSLGLIDPSTGAERLLPLDGVHSYKWSPDSRSLLVVTSYEESLVAIDVASGATQVVAWRVLAGSSKSSLKTAVSKASKTGFETAISVNGSPKVVEVQALASSGKVLGTSKPFGTGHPALVGGY